MASSLAKRYPQLLSGLTLIDPVCFAMFLPHLVRRTLQHDAAWAHRASTGAAEPSEREAVAGLGQRGAQQQPRRWQPIRSLMKGLVIRELHCAAAMSHRFRWSDLNMWTSDIPEAATTVVLGGKDNMIPAAEVLQMLSSPAAAARGVKVMFDPEMGHGSFLMNLELQRRIITGGLPPLNVAVPTESANVADEDERAELLPWITSHPLSPLSTRAASGLAVGRRRRLHKVSEAQLAVAAAKLSYALEEEEKATSAAEAGGEPVPVRPRSRRQAVHGQSTKRIQPNPLRIIHRLRQLFRRSQRQAVVVHQSSQARPQARMMQ